MPEPWGKFGRSTTKAIRLVIDGPDLAAEPTRAANALIEA
jgi:hypothetical protein